MQVPLGKAQGDAGTGEEAGRGQRGGRTQRSQGRLGNSYIVVKIRNCRRSCSLSHFSTAHWDSGRDLWHEGEIRRAATVISHIFFWLAAVSSQCPAYILWAGSSLFLPPNTALLLQPTIYATAHMYHHSVCVRKRENIRIYLLL